MTDEQRKKRAEKQRAYYAANREAEQQKARARRAADPEKYRAARKRRYEANADVRRAKSREYYAANRIARAAWSVDYRKRNRDAVRARKRRAAYGLAESDFRSMWDAQGGRCPICGDVLIDDGRRRTHVDHDHQTGRVRGLLCVDCNVGLGRFKDSPEALMRAAAYLESLVRVFPGAT